MDVKKILSIGTKRQVKSDYSKIMLHLRNLDKLFYLIQWKNTDHAVLFEFIKQISEVLLKRMCGINYFVDLPD